MLLFLLIAHPTSVLTALLLAQAQHAAGYLPKPRHHLHRTHSLIGRGWSRLWILLMVSGVRQPREQRRQLTEDQLKVLGSWQHEHQPFERFRPGSPRRRKCLGCSSRSSDRFWTYFYRIEL